MGIGGIGIWQLVIILVIIVMLFGTKKLRNVGSDLGGALKGFKNAMKDEDGKPIDSDEDVTVKKVGDASVMKSEKTDDRD